MPLLGPEESSVPPRRYWIGVVSREHILRGVAEGFIQLNHGKKAPLQKLRPGDGLVIYSPRTAYPDGATLQAFTALGWVAPGDISQVSMSPDFHPYRRAVHYLPVQEAPIQPLIAGLACLPNKTHWGAALRFGLLSVSAADFALIALAMGLVLES